MTQVKKSINIQTKYLIMDQADHTYIKSSERSGNKLLQELTIVDFNWVYFIVYLPRAFKLSISIAILLLLFLRQRPANLPRLASNFWSSRHTVFRVVGITYVHHHTQLSWVMTNMNPYYLFSLNYQLMTKLLTQFQLT